MCETEPDSSCSQRQKELIVQIPLRAPNLVQTIPVAGTLDLVNEGTTSRKKEA